MKLACNQAKLFAAIKANTWFTNAAIAETAGVSLSTACRFTRHLWKMQIVERLDIRPEPLFKLSGEPTSPESQNHLTMLREILEYRQSES